MNFDILKKYMDSLNCREGIEGGTAPGSNIVIYKNHERIFSYSTGLADIEEGILTTTEHSYDIYSCSKITTAVAAMQLIERGVIAFDDPVSKYIPAFADIKVKDKDKDGNVIGLRTPKREVLIRHLLTMTSGMEYNMHSPEIEQVIADTNGRAPTLEVCRALAMAPLDFDPGEGYRYSASLDVMGGVIEVASGMKFSKYVEENIFIPLGMTQTTYHPDPNAENRVTHYTYLKDAHAIKRCPKEQAHHRLGTEYDGGGGGMASTASDYILLMDALACGGVGATGKRILKTETVDLMRTPTLNKEQNRAFVTEYSKGYEYCYGVRVLTDPDTYGNLATLGSFGWDGWKMCYAVADPARRISAFFTAALDGFHDTLINPLRNAIYASMLAE